MIYRFGPFELDDDAGVLFRGGERVALRARLLDVLVHLVRHRDRVVTHRELIEGVWSSGSVTPSVVPWSISRLRKTLAQAGAPSPISTVSRRGYRFCGTVQTTSSRGIGATDDAERRAATPPADDTFVGREETLRDLASGLASAHAGSGGFLLLVGEPGVGRTRCAHEFALRAKDQASIWSTSCGRTPDARPLSAWLDLLRSCAREQPADPALHARAEQLVRELHDHSDRADRAPATELHLLFEKVCSFIEDACGTRTRILLIDDVDRADPASLHLLDLLSSRILTCRIMILATLRELPHDPSDPQDARLLALRSRARLIPLLPWSHSETERMVAASVPPDQVERMTQAVWRRAHGNPLLTRELLRHQRLYGGSSELRSTDLSGLPSSLTQLVRHRLQALPAGTAATLGAASVLGHRFSLTLLHRLTGESLSTLLEVLDRAHFAGLIQRTDRVSEYTFGYDLVHSTVYTDLPGDQRARLHLGAGEILQDAEGGNVPASVLARHFYAAAAVGGAARAVHHATRAALDARGLAAYTDEVRFREWALEAHALTSDPAPGERCELLISLAIARTANGEGEAARRHLTRAVEIAESANLPEALARAAFILRSSMLLGNHPDPVALRALERAYRTLPEHAHGLRSRVASYLASTPPYSQQPDQRWQLLDEGLDLARRQTEPIPLFDALRARCAAWVGPTTLDELLECSNEIEALAERTGSAPMLHEGQQYRYLALLQLGRPLRPAALREKRGRLGRHKASHEIGWLYRSLAVRHVYYWGLLQGATKGYRDIRGSSGGVRSWICDATYGVGMSLVHLELDTARDFWSEFQSVTRGLQRSSRTLSVVAARLRLASGRVDEVRDEFPRIYSAQLDQQPCNLGVLCQLGLVAVGLDDVERCAEIYARLLPFVDLVAVDDLWFSHGSVAYFLGVLAGASGKSDEARGHLEKALERNVALGYRVQAAWTKYQLARTLRVQGEDARASQLLREVSEAAQAQHFHALLRRVEIDAPALGSA